MCYHEIKGDLFSEQERFDEAYQSYSMALGGREKMYPADVNAIKRLEQKCENARVGRDEDMPFLDIWT